MKHTTIIIAIIMLTTQTFAIGGPDIKPSILRYQPTPAEAGSTIDAWIQLTNQGTSAENVLLKFIDEYPFTTPIGAQKEFKIGTIAARESKVQKFTIFVAPDAPSGDTTMKFQYSKGIVESTTQWTEFTTPITITGTGASLVVENYQITPTPLVPGQTTKLEIKLRNAGKLALKNIDARIDLTEKFSTIGTGTKQRINYLGVGQTQTISFQVASDTSTEVQLYNIPLLLDYEDEKNAKHADTGKISIVVNAEPEITIFVEETKFEKKTQPGTVSLKIINKGISNLKYLTVKLLPSKQYEILAPTNEAYIGNLDSDDFETTEFTIRTKEEQPMLSLQLEFKDPYNKNFIIKREVPLKIITEKDLEKGKTPTTTIILLLLTISGCVYYVWRKKQKKHK